MLGRREEGTMPKSRAKPAPDFLLSLMASAALVIGGAAVAQQPEPQAAGSDPLRSSDYAMPGMNGPDRPADFHD